MTDEEIKKEFLLKTYSNIHYEEGKRVLELNKQSLKKFFNANEIIIK